MPVSPRRSYGGGMTQLIIDADTHLTEPPDVWTARVPARYLDRGAARRAQRRGPRRVGARRHAVQQPRADRGRGLARAVPRRPADLRGVPPGVLRRRRPPRATWTRWGSGRRCSTRTSAGFGSQRFLNIRDDELKLVCVQRLQRLPPRLGVGRRPPPAHDHGHAVLGHRRGGRRRSSAASTTGHRGILFTGEPQRFGLPYLGEAHWDPLWSIAQDARLPIHFHIGSGEMTHVVRRPSASPRTAPPRPTRTRRSRCS